MVTLEELKLICPYSSPKRIELFVEPLNAAMREFEISDSPVREMAFIAQIAHESGGFNYVRELASGDAYEGRADLGNTEPGDGRRFRGRGLIQITGRANYRACGDVLGVDLVSQPELLESPVLAARSAAWFWRAKGLNHIADIGDFREITKRINGGLNGWRDRVAYFNRAQQALA